MQKRMERPETGSKSPRTRGRPRAFDRDVALAQATRLFWEKGYEATSITDLAQAMGIGSPSLYAAFGSKAELYTEALRHYAETNEHIVWAQFHAAATAREAVAAFLMDSAAALTGGVGEAPRGCMITLSAVGSEGYSDLGEMVRSARGLTLERLATRLSRAVVDGEIAASTDLGALARFVQAVQAGMSILARDGVRQSELEAMAEVAMSGWDARTQAMANKSA
ncbi:TetR/AcrR family transcriptional regulator [Aurantiacibacter flavus]|uniref:TetR/AcrR family transcriptional regulator n=1 Tax=Aurantiacibacter flavus TaxID=3145232 RepID=A0ABV0CZ91_9SPHN